jgi:hypothetical protein
MDAHTLTQSLGGRWGGGCGSARCPCHDDRTASLSIRDGDKAILLKCHAGCDTKEIMDRLRDRGLLNGDARPHPKPTVDKIYDYHTANGEFAFQVLRFKPKTFRQRRPDGRGGHIYNMQGVERVLYHLPEVIAAVAERRPIFIAEGEKAVDKLIEIGVIATCSPGGAGKWRNSYSQTLKGADVVVLRDNDEPGELHANDVTTSLSSVAQRVRTLRLPNLPAKGDPYDWLAAGGTATELWNLVDAVTGPEPQQEPNGVLLLEDWLKRDLPEPDFLLGEWLTTTSRVLLVGPTGLGKTMFGLAVAVAVAAGQSFLNWTAPRTGCVLYIDGEMSRRLMKARLQDAVRRAGVTPSGLLALSREDFESMPPLNTPEGRQWIGSFVEQHGLFDLIIFDNIQAPLVGNMRDEEQWAEALPLVRDLTRRHIGQIWFHHTGHDETRSYGSKAREWQMDTVGLLKRVEDSDTEDLTFTLEFTKARERTRDNREDFDPITTSLIGDKWTAAAVSPASKVGGAPKIALDILKRCIAEASERPPASNHIPPDIRAVKASLWRKCCYQGTISEADTPDSKQKAFRRAQQKLQEFGKIGVWNEWVWLV